MRTVVVEKVREWFLWNEFGEGGIDLADPRCPVLVSEWSVSWDCTQSVNYKSVTQCDLDASPPSHAVDEKSEAQRGNRLWEITWLLTIGPWWEPRTLDSQSRDVWLSEALQSVSLFFLRKTYMIWFHGLVLWIPILKGNPAKRLEIIILAFKLWCIPWDWVLKGLLYSEVPHAKCSYSGSSTALDLQECRCSTGTWWIWCVINAWWMEIHASVTLLQAQAEL